MTFFTTFVTSNDYIAGNGSFLIAYMVHRWLISYGESVTYIDGSCAVYCIGLSYSTNLSK